MQKYPHDAGRDERLIVLMEAEESARHQMTDMAIFAHHLRAWPTKPEGVSVELNTAQTQITVTDQGTRHRYQLRPDAHSPDFYLITSQGNTEGILGEIERKTEAEAIAFLRELCCP